MCKTVVRSALPFFFLFFFFFLAWHTCHCNWEGSHNTCSPHFTSVDQPQTDSEDKDGGVQCLRCQHTDALYRDVDLICQTGEKTQFLPPEKYPPYPWHILARVSNTEVLARTNLPSMYTLLRQRRLRWLGHVYRMEDGRIPKDILYGEFASGRRTKGRPQLRYKDVCKRDMRALDINTESWEDLAAFRMLWRSTLIQHLKTSEKKLVNEEVAKKGPQKRAQQLQQSRDHTQMQLLQQRLFLPHRSLQLQATLQQSNRHDNQDVLPCTN